jgi:hypothetical protein
MIGLKVSMICICKCTFQYLYIVLYCIVLYSKFVSTFIVFSLCYIQIPWPIAVNMSTYLHVYYWLINNYEKQLSLFIYLFFIYLFICLFVQMYNSHIKKTIEKDCIKTQFKNMY